LLSQNLTIISRLEKLEKLDNILSEQRKIQDRLSNLEKKIDSKKDDEAEFLKVKFK
jgi:CHASE3 domain sensor protein